MQEAIKNNLEQIRKRIAEACSRCGRDPSSVGLIAVSKMNPAQAVIDAAACGQLVFGENKVQELCGKQDEVSASGSVPPLEWHLIGHLQTNKVKYVIGRVKLIHSVDSLKLACEISKESIKKGVITDILLEVNISSEDSKFGLKPDEVLPLANEISGLENLRVKGLMTVAPYTDDPETNRIYFKKLKDLSVDISSQNIDNISMNVLSMGMTGDFEVAIEEGATLIRVGTGIFGARDYFR